MELSTLFPLPCLRAAVRNPSEGITGERILTEPLRHGGQCADAFRADWRTGRKLVNVVSDGWYQERMVDTDRNWKIGLGFQIDSFLLAPNEVACCVKHRDVLIDEILSLIPELEMSSVETPSGIFEEMVALFASAPSIRDILESHPDEQTTKLLVSCVPFTIRRSLFNSRSADWSIYKSLLRRKYRQAKVTLKDQDAQLDPTIGNFPDPFRARA